MHHPTREPLRCWMRSLEGRSRPPRDHARFPTGVDEQLVRNRGTKMPRMHSRPIPELERDLSKTPRWYARQRCPLGNAMPYR